MEFVTRHSVSTVTAMVSEAQAHHLIDVLLAEDNRHVLLLDGRGTAVRDAWYDRFLPVISPSMRIVHMMVPDQEVDRIMQVMVDAGDMARPGGGAVFTTPCDEFRAGPDYPVWLLPDDPHNLSHDLKENLSVIVAIAHRDQSQGLTREAVRAGAHGPVVHFCEGRGLRDRVGWLRITKQSDMEVLTVIVDNADVEAVFEVLMAVGRFDLPGRGFAYRMPARQGLINLPGLISSRRQPASVQQIVAALDELKGSSDWRAREVTTFGTGGGRAAGLGFLGRKRVQYRRHQTCLSCVCERDHAELFMDAALAGGASGINLSYSRLSESHSEEAQPGAARLNKEEGLLRSILNPGQLAPVLASMEQRAEREGITDMCFYTQPVVWAVSYIGNHTSAASAKR